MNIKAFLAVSLLASCTGLAACSKKAPEPVHPPRQPEPAESQSAPGRTSFPEPPEDVLKKLMLKAYEKLDDAGGLPVTVTATGKSGRIRVRLVDVRKSECKLIDIPSIAPPGKFDCTVNLRVKMWWDGQLEPSEPGEDNKGIDVIQDDLGNWLDCTHEAEKNKDFCDARAATRHQGRK